MCSFFFISRRRHTRYWRDWSSDVCSSDLVSFEGTRLTHGSRRHYNYTSPIYQQKSRAITEALAEHYKAHPAVIGWQIDNRSEERRVGKECRSRWSPYH